MVLERVQIDTSLYSMMRCHPLCEPKMIPEITNFLNGVDFTDFTTNAVCKKAPKRMRSLAYDVISRTAQKRLRLDL